MSFLRKKYIYGKIEYDSLSGIKMNRFLPTLTSITFGWNCGSAKITLSSFVVPNIEKCHFFILILYLSLIIVFCGTLGAQITDISDIQKNHTRTYKLTKRVALRLKKIFVCCNSWIRQGNKEDLTPKWNKQINKHTSIYMITKHFIHAGLTYIGIFWPIFRKILR